MRKKPDIIVFMTDQQNAKTIWPRQMAITPHVTAFCQNAVTFSEAYCVAPHCCPSRASFFSGLYPSQHGVWNNVEVDNAISRGLYDGVTLFPELLKKNGYHTVFSGKWHVSACEGPLERGFDEVLFEKISNYGRFAPKNRGRNRDWEELYSHPGKIDFSGKKERPGQTVRIGYPIHDQYGEEEDPFEDSVTVRRACEAIETHCQGEAPLFLYVGTTGPHDPYCPPREYLERYRDRKVTLPSSFGDGMMDKPALYRRTRERYGLTVDEHVESLRHYLAFASYEDTLFGRLVEAVKRSGNWENTYIFYVSDHGDYMGAHGLWAKGLPCFREAYHICAVVGGGAVCGGSVGNAIAEGQISGIGVGKNGKRGVPEVNSGARVVDEMVSITDFAPTILELAGICPDVWQKGSGERDSDIPAMTGKSLCEFLRGTSPGKWRTELFTQTNGNELYGIQRAVWNRKWKYVFNGFDYDELYDLEQDPGELVNLIGEQELAPVVRQMCRKMWLFARQTGDTCTCPYIMVSLAPYGPGIVWEEEESEDGYDQGGKRENEDDCPQGCLGS